MQAYPNERPVHKTRCIGLRGEEVFRIFCMLGALFQIIYVLDRYFQYDFLTRVYVAVPETTVFPDVVVCFDSVNTLNFTKLFERYPNIARAYGFAPGTRISSAQRKTLFDRFTQNGVLHYLGKQLTIREYWELMYPQEVIIDSVKIRQVINRTTVMNPCRIKDFLTETAYCYAFACSYQAPAITYYRDLYREVQSPSIFTLNLKQEFFSSNGNYYMALIPPNTLPRGQRIKWETQNAFNHTRNHKYFFYSLEVDYLPPPYPTNCRNYTAEGYKSQIFMKDTCQIELAVKRTGSPFPGSLMDTPLDVPFGFVVFEENRQNETFRKMIADIVEHCDKITRQPDCVYKAYIISSRTPLPISGNFTQVTIDHIKDPISIVTMEPRMTMLDCIIMIGSVLGTWLGFSVAYHVPKVSIFCYQKACQCCCEGHGSHLSKGNSNYPYNIDPGLVTLDRFRDKDESMKIHRIINTSSDLRARKSPPRRLPFYLYYDEPKPPRNYNVGEYSFR